MTTDAESRLTALGLTLPSAAAALGVYIPVVQMGSLLVTSGQLPMVNGQCAVQGKVGRDVSEAEGQEAARICTLNALAQLKAHLGSLDRVQRIIRVEGYVQSAEGFSKQPVVLNGASELLGQIFGDAGRHTRVAVGVAELPLNAAVELAIWADVG